MQAYCYTEAMGKKGGNNVASMILTYVLEHLLPPLIGGPAPPPTIDQPAASIVKSLKESEILTRSNKIWMEGNIYQ